MRTVSKKKVAGKRAALRAASKVQPEAVSRLLRAMGGPDRSSDTRTGIRASRGAAGACLAPFTGIS
jgi:hypothetical protein